MAIIKGSKSASAPIVASESEYGLYVGPQGGFGKAGIQCKEAKWGNLFVAGPDGTPMLMNVLEYLEENHTDFASIEAGVEAFIAAYAEWKAAVRTAA